MALKLPELLDVIVDGLVVTALPSNLIVMRVLEANLVPDTVTVVPARPAVGDRVISASVVTVNVAGAVLPA